MDSKFLKGMESRFTLKTHSKTPISESFKQGQSTLKAVSGVIVGNSNNILLLKYLLHSKRLELLLDFTIMTHLEVNEVYV